jgi:hypothetical protein
MPTYTRAMRDDSPLISKAELIEAARAIIGGDVKALPLAALLRLMTVTQFVTDLCLNELERCGELEFDEGSPLVPYSSVHHLETVLTRLGPPDESGEWVGEE